MSNKATIEEVFSSARKKSTPVLLNFQNGNFNPEKATNLKYTTSSNDKNEKHAILTANDNLFHGKIGEGYPTDLISTYIAVRNKITNKVKLIEIEQASLVNNIYSQKVQNLNNTLTGQSSNNALIKNFGGRRANRYLDRVERMKVSVDVIKDQLEKTVDDADAIDDLNETKIFDNEKNIANIRPVFNKSAQKLDDIYVLTDVIPNDVLDRLQEEADAVLNASIEELPIPSEYILQKIKEIQESDNPKSLKNITIIKVLIYMDALITLIRSKNRTLGSLECSKITEKVETDIRARFTLPELSNKLLTSYTKDKALCYFLVLALLTSPNYEIDLNILIQELSVPRQKIVKYAHYINAKTKYKTDILRLQLPESIKPLKPFTRKRNAK